MNELVAPKPYGDWRINNFDLIRLLAALQVAITHVISAMHVPGFFARIVQFGLSFFPGVPIFFVVSGFLISKSYEHSDLLRDYFRNRCLRIYPGLWVALAVTVGVMFMAGSRTRCRSESGRRRHRTGRCPVTGKGICSLVRTTARSPPWSSGKLVT